MRLVKIEEKSLRATVKVFQARTSRKGLKEGRVTLRYLAVLPLRGLNARWGWFLNGGKRDGNGRRDLRASAPELKEVRNIFMIFPG